jgi:hypothetical protein
MAIGKSQVAEHKIRFNMKDEEEMMMCRNNHGPESTERSMPPPIDIKRQHLIIGLHIGER